MDEDPLQRRIYFLTFIDSLDMIFLNIEKLRKKRKLVLLVLHLTKIRVVQLGNDLDADMKII